jgi:uncharacterized membrane protein
MQKKRRRAPVSRHLAKIIERNITTLLEVRRQMEARRSPQARFADYVAKACGNPLFAYLHVLWFGAWLLWNTGVLGLDPFDPYPFSFLTLVVSLEAIFLSMFVLISQNHLGELSEQRADLDLQINLLNEYETTKILRIIDAIADKMGLHEGNDPELQELEREILPENLLKEMEMMKVGLGLTPLPRKKKKK